MTDPVLTYETGKTLYILAKPSSGYGTLDEADLIVTDVNGNALPVHKSSTWSDTNPVYYVSSADLTTDGGITVSAEFPTAAHSITFKLDASSAKSAKLTLGAQEQTISDTTGKTFDLEPGTTVTITSDNSAYNRVKAKSAAYDATITDTSITYVVPNKDDTVTITLTSSNPAVTVNAMSHGGVNLRKDNDASKLPEQASNFGMSDKVYIEVIPDTGYTLKSLKVKDVNGNDVGTASSAPSDHEVTSIPTGGITISATFEPVSVALTYNITGAHAATDIVATANGVNILGSGGGANADFDSTITITLADDYAWDTTPVTVSGGITAKVSGKTATFDVTKTGTITVALNVKYDP